MAKLIYSAIASLDGYISDEHGKFDWAMPDEHVHRFVNDLERPVGTYLFGRRMYETMVWWESPENWSREPDYIQQYAQIWQDAEKIVYSTTLESVASERTSLEREFDADAIRDLKRSSRRDISIGGPTLAAQAIAAGLVDEYQLFVVPVAVGGGLPAFPPHLRLDLTLRDERRFDNGTVYLRYEPR